MTKLLAGVVLLLIVSFTAYQVVMFTVEKRSTQYAGDLYREPSCEEMLGGYSKVTEACCRLGSRMIGEPRWMFFNEGTEVCKQLYKAQKEIESKKQEQRRARDLTIIQGHPQ